MKGEKYLVTTRVREKRRQMACSLDPRKGAREQYGANDKRGEFKQATSNRRGRQEEGIKREGARLTGEAQQRCPS